jgi:hypothetical protein
LLEVVAIRRKNAGYESDNRFIEYLGNLTVDKRFVVLDPGLDMCFAVPDPGRSCFSVASITIRISPLTVDHIFTHIFWIPFYYADGLCLRLN